mmetsp:Transcript_127668/g.367415  ORF Transcript_127668/g.367415 Transcript_127668/m.367415 type:complete len:293 (-) Transcript_127668:12-890(-)
MLELHSHRAGRHRPFLTEAEVRRGLPLLAFFTLQCVARVPTVDFVEMAATGLVRVMPLAIHVPRQIHVNQQALADLVRRVPVLRWGEVDGQPRHFRCQVLFSRRPWLRRGPGQWRQRSLSLPRRTEAPRACTRVGQRRCRQALELLHATIHEPTIARAQRLAAAWSTRCCCGAPTRGRRSCRGLFAKLAAAVDAKGAFDLLHLRVRAKACAALQQRLEDWVDRLRWHSQLPGEQLLGSVQRFFGFLRRWLLRWRRCLRRHGGNRYPGKASLTPVPARNEKLATGRACKPRVA